MLAPVSVIENVPLYALSQIVDMFRLGSRCHNERVGDINGMAAGITVQVAIERGDGLLFHLIALPVEDEVLEDGDGRRAHGFSFLPWGGSVAVPLAVYKYSRPAYQQAGEPYKFTKPKTRAAIRSIYLDEDTLSELAAWRKVQRVVIPDCEFVLSYNGLPTTKTRLPRAMKKLADLAGVHRVRVHDLRHSHASLLINMGESPLLLKERLGHEKIQTTLGTYGHLYPNTNQAVAKKLTGILNYSEPKTSIANYTSNQHTADYHRA